MRSKGVVPRKFRKPKNSKLYQQKLRSYKPNFTPVRVIAPFILLGSILILIGVAHLLASDNVVEIVKRYDDACIPMDDKHSPEEARKARVDFIQDSGTNKTCFITLEVRENMKHPIYVYYKLERFYQNHRGFVMKKTKNNLAVTSERQNFGKAKFDEGCKPEAGNRSDPIIPCGLMAWSLFNDSYTMSVNETPISINKTGIAWESDRKYRFQSLYPLNFQSQGLIGGGQLNASLPLNQQEELLVWIRTAPTSTFRKIYGRIDQDLHMGDKIRVNVQNNYNTYSFEGKKLLVLSTTTWIGGKITFLGVAFIIVGALYILVGLTLMVCYLVKPRPVGDPNHLSWNKNRRKPAE